MFLTQVDFDKIEQELQIELPLYYKDFHLNQNDLIQEMRQGQGPLSHEEHIMLATDVNWLLQTNKELEIPKKEGPCRGKFCIGTDGGGSDVFISLVDPTDTIVYQAAHDQFPYEEIFDEELDDLIWSHEGLHMGRSLEDFVRQVIQQNKEFDEDQTGY